MLPDMWDALQQGQINSATTQAGTALRSSRENSIKLYKEIRRLESKINGLALVSQALWELVRENTELTEQDIESKIEEIDLRDDRKDGKMTGKPSKCNKCTRPVHTKQNSCMYCGEETGTSHVFNQP